MLRTWPDVKLLQSRASLPHTGLAFGGPTHIHTWVLHAGLAERRLLPVARVDKILPVHLSQVTLSELFHDRVLERLLNVPGQAKPALQRAQIEAQILPMYKAF